MRHIFEKHGIHQDYHLDFVMLWTHDTITDEQFEVRLRTISNYKTCLREIMQTAHGTALSYLEDE
jgi:hypothetical protein